jgi:nitroreductase
MTGSPLLLAVLTLLLLGPMATRSAAQEPADVPLPAPRTEGGKPLMQALRERQSNRSFAQRKLPDQVLSDLLWAAAGINRPESGKRTVPSARDWQEVAVYAVTAEGAFLYDAKANRLAVVVKRDLRGLTGGQDFVATAPLNLVYVADTAKMKGAAPEDQPLYMGADTGFMVQNVYLFCASEGLSVVVRSLVDRAALAAALNLPAEKKITLVQTVGYPGTPGQ